MLVLGASIGGGFYLLLIDITARPELYVMAGVAIACGAAFLLAREQGFTEARIAPRWLLTVWRVILRIPPDVMWLCSEALLQAVRPRPTRGSFRAAPFGATGDDSDAVGRRATTEWIGSISPNTIVVGIDAERGLVLVHQLRRQGDTDQLDPLRLG
jgi:hypothetical protein